jgi:hypothetical protein
MGLKAYDLLARELPRKLAHGRRETKAEVMQRLANYVERHPPLPVEDDPEDKSAVQLKFQDKDFERLQAMAERMNVPLNILVLVTATRMIDEERT